MNPHLAHLVAVLGIVGVLSGCGAPDETDTTDDDFSVSKAVRLRDDALAMSSTFSNQTTVLESELRVRRTEAIASELERVQVGSVLGGDRAADGDANPNGFLRRVLERHVEGDFLVLNTRQAELEEWMLEGDLGANGAAPFPSAVEGQALRVLGGATGSEGAATSTESTEVKGDPITERETTAWPMFRTSNVRYQLNPKFDADLKIRSRGGIGIKRAFASLEIEPEISADIEVGIQVTNERSKPWIPNVKEFKKSWGGKAFKIPIAGGGVPTTVVFRPTYECDIKLKGAGLVKFRTNFHGHAHLGFEYKNKAFTNLSTMPTMIDGSASPIALGAELTGGAECTVQLAVQVLLFDTVGIEGRIGPYLKIEAQTCSSTASPTPQFSLAEDHGLRLNFDARVQLPLFGNGRRFPLSEHELLSRSSFVLGSETTCPQ